MFVISYIEPVTDFNNKKTFYSFYDYDLQKTIFPPSFIICSVESEKGFDIAKELADYFFTITYKKQYGVIVQEVLELDLSRPLEDISEPVTVYNLLPL